jgi:hypothetical protein
MDGFRELKITLPELGAAVPTRFKKEILRVGRFVDPASNEVFNFDRGGLEELAQATNLWIATGHKVHFPSSGDIRDAYDAGKNLGYWTNFAVEDGALVAEVSVPREEIGIKIGATIQNTCPYFERDAQSATGQDFDLVIVYVAACTNVVMGGLGAFLALSRSPRRLRLTAEQELDRDTRAAELLLDREVEVDATGQIRAKGRRAP